MRPWAYVGCVLSLVAGIGCSSESAKTERAAGSSAGGTGGAGGVAGTGAGGRGGSAGVAGGNTGTGGTTSLDACQVPAGCCATDLDCASGEECTGAVGCAPD